MVSRACNPNCYAMILSANKGKAFQSVASKTKGGQSRWNKDSNGDPVFVPLYSALGELRGLSPETTLYNLIKLYNHQELDKETDRFIYTEQKRFPVGPRLPATCFIDDVSDFFHEQSFKHQDFMDKCMDSFENMDFIHFQLLTKRTQRMLEYSQRRPFPDNVWAGTTCETTDKNFRGQNYSWDGEKEVKVGGIQANYENALKGVPLHDGVPPWERPKLLAQVQAKVRFLSVEPMTGPIELDKKTWEKISWVIIGGESDGYPSRNLKGKLKKKDKPTKPVMRLCDIADIPNGVKDLLKQCKRHKVPVWFKQWGSYNEDGVYLGGHAMAGHEVSGGVQYGWPTYYENILRKGR
jgi:protein gp37